MSYKTVPQKIKEFGAKVTRKCKGWYTYHGLTVTIDVTEESCESTWWELDIYVNGTDEQLYDEFNGVHFETKSEAVWAIFCYDQMLSKRI